MGHALQEDIPQKSRGHIWRSSYIWAAVGESREREKTSGGKKKSQ